MIEIISCDGKPNSHTTFNLWVRVKIWSRSYCIRGFIDSNSSGIDAVNLVTTIRIIAVKGYTF